MIGILANRENGRDGSPTPEKPKGPEHIRNRRKPRAVGTTALDGIANRAMAKAAELPPTELGTTHGVVATMGCRFSYRPNRRFTSIDGVAMAIRPMPKRKA